MSYAFPQEIRNLLEEELATGLYVKEDEVLLEAMRLLRDRNLNLRRFKAQLGERLDRMARSEVIELANDEALDAFFDAVEERGMDRCKAAEFSA